MYIIYSQYIPNISKQVSDIRYLFQQIKYWGRGDDGGGRGRIPSSRDDSGSIHLATVLIHEPNDTNN